MLEPPGRGCLPVQPSRREHTIAAAWGSRDHAWDQQIIGKDGGPQVRHARLMGASLPDRKRATFSADRQCSGVIVALRAQFCLH